MRTLAMLIMAAVAATPAAARDRSGYTSIAAGDWSQAEATLSAERAIFPHRPEILLNLAAVYLRTDRAAQARALYGDVLASEPVSLDLANGHTVSSHVIAQRGLARLNTTIAAR
ncbi:tetratricopeptide repeat protein [Sphingomonas sp. RHCKR47]|uniref:tetratricopeptide repeat protein n=1 Tax=Sphingomonas citricola TaxID=2862498 RepID=UPI001C672695|nr:tetratricopeptide repeat protein [Sphingomonas citricola]MBW6522648.1 tetratricopeptide repeat protein [Sphingomonas citricola]